MATRKRRPWNADKVLFPELVGGEAQPPPAPLPDLKAPMMPSTPDMRPVETLDLTRPRDLWIVGVEYRGEMGLSAWDAPAHWQTEYALIVGLPPGVDMPMVVPELARLGATAERLPESLRQDFDASLRVARSRGAQLVLCYWRSGAVVEIERKPVSLPDPLGLRSASAPECSMCDGPATYKVDGEWRCPKH